MQFELPQGVFDALKHMCDKEIVFDGYTFKVISEESMKIQLTYWQPAIEGWYALSSLYLGAGYYRTLYASADGSELMQRVVG